MGWLQKIFGKSVTPWNQDGGRGWDFLGRFKPWRPSDKIWKDLNTGQLEAAYRNAALIYACVRELATTAGEPPLVVTKINPEDPDFIEPVRDHWAAELIRKPNPYYTRSMLIYYDVIRLLLTGSSHIWKFRNALMPSELWPIPTAWVKLQTGEGNELIRGFKVKQAGGHEMEVPYADMLYQWFPDPSSTWAAAGPLKACSHDFQLDEERSNYIAEMLENLKVPGLKIKTPVPLTPDQKTDLRAALHDQVGKGNRGQPLIISGEGADAEIMNPLADLDMPGLAMMTESRICMSFGMPAIIVGARVGIEHMTYSNYGEARISLYKETMKPLWTYLGESYTHGLLVQEGDDDHRIVCDTRAIPELQEDQNKAAERAKTLVLGSIATRNEARAMAGLPEDKGPRGKLYLIPANVMEIDPDEELDHDLGDEGDGGDTGNGNGQRDDQGGSDDGAGGDTGDEG